MIKQVIVVRNDLNMRKGKMIVQGAHAVADIIEQVCWSWDQGWGWRDEKIGQIFDTWKATGSTKICVRVDTEPEFHAIYDKAEAAELLCSKIQDAGRTEFNEPTYTALAIGPGDADEIDKITRHLKPL